MPKYTRTETVEAWQWNGPENNRGVVTPYKSSGGNHYRIRPRSHGQASITFVCSGDWIIKRGDRYEVISDAKFKAQEWKEIGE